MIRPVADQRGPVTRAVSGVRTLFELRAEGTHAPSSSWGVFDRDGLVASGSTGEIGGAPPRPDAIYRIASCTKSFTATVLLALRDEGRLSLDAPVTDFVPAFADVELPTADSPVPTVRMLLTMSAGLPTDDPWGDRQESIGDDELDALLRRGLTFDSVPGTRFAYSNLGYALLGRVIAEVENRPYRDVVTDRILRPLHLDSTGFVRPEGLDDRLAVGHRSMRDAWEPLPFSGPGAFSSIGGLFSTVPDLARWASWLASAFDDAQAASQTEPDARPQDHDASGTALTTGRAGGWGDADGILSKASRREMQQAQRSAAGTPTAPTGYGFGLVVEEQPGLGPIVSHSGGYPGFSAHMRWQPSSGWGIVAFENATYAQVSVPATTAIHGLLRELDTTPQPRVLPEVAAAAVVVETAVVTGADLPSGLLSENVDLDMPLDLRHRGWAEAIEAIGGLEPGAVLRQDRRAGDTAVVDPILVDSTLVDSEAGDESSAPSHLVWRLAGRRGRLRLEIRTTPERPPRVQTVVVRPERLG